MKVTKLDSYDYEIESGVIRIFLSGMNDPDQVDIMSELNRTDGRIYVEGRRFIYLDNYRVRKHRTRTFMELDVVEKY